MLKMFEFLNFFTPKSQQKVVAEEQKHIAFNSQNLVFLLETPEEKEMWENYLTRSGKRQKTILI